MRLLALLAAGLMVGPLVFAADRKGEKVKDEELIVGTWKAVEMDAGTGKSFTPEEMENQGIALRDGKLVATVDGGKGATVEYRIDPSARPRTFDVVGKDWKTLAIYDLDGDTLKLCYNLSGSEKDRPTEFKGDEKKKHLLVVLKRVKDK
jgi:uncharacterized protein (TIGR03067 family)